MTVFGAIFEVNNSIGKLRDLQGHFDKKDTVDVNKIIMLHMHIRQLYNFSPNRKTFLVRDTYI